MNGKDWSSKHQLCSDIIIFCVETNEWLYLFVLRNQQNEKKYQQNRKKNTRWKLFIRLYSCRRRFHSTSPHPPTDASISRFLLFVSVCIVAQKNSRWANEDESSYFRGALRISCAITFVVDVRGKINLKGFQQNVWRHLWPFLNGK